MLPTQRFQLNRVKVTTASPSRLPLRRGKDIFKVQRLLEQGGPILPAGAGRSLGKRGGAGQQACLLPGWLLLRYAKEVDIAGIFI